MDWHRLLTPSAWVQNYPSCKKYDKALNDALTKHGIKKVGSHTCFVGDVEIWVQNYPYAFGYEWKRSCRLMPLLKTRRRLKKMVDEVMGDKEESNPWK